MSSVVIAGDISGSITIAAPATAGSNTLTLPVATDTLVGKATTDTLTNKTLVAPALGTPISGNLVNCSGIPNSVGFKNRIINGGMVIDQRNAGASVTPAGDTYLVDRFAYFASQVSKFTWQQNKGSVTPPVGFTNYLGGSVASAVTIGSSDYFGLFQSIEGYNIADLGFGTANAKTITISFQVYSSLTGTFGGALRNSGGSRTYPFTYTVSSANTWTTINITVAGDTSGTWLTTNGTGLQIVFSLGIGSTLSGTAGSWSASNVYSATGATSVVGTSGATFYITGVQLEKGSTDTSFDFRAYSTELAMCQRYYWKGNLPIMRNWTGSTIAVSSSIGFPVTMRATPSIGVDTGAVDSSYASSMSSYQSSIGSGSTYTPGNGYVSAEL
jgi:hypothetical protein